MTESSISERGSRDQGIPGAVYGQLWGRHQGIWWNGLISTSIHFAHSTLRTSSFLLATPLRNCYKLQGYLRRVF